MLRVVEINKLKPTEEVGKYHLKYLEKKLESFDPEYLFDSFPPVTVDKHNNIIDGHHRVFLLKKYGATHVKVTSRA